MPDGITTFGGANKNSLYDWKSMSSINLYLVFIRNRSIPESILSSMEEAERIVSLLRKTGIVAYWEEYDERLLNTYLSSLQYPDNDIFDNSRTFKD